MPGGRITPRCDAGLDQAKPLKETEEEAKHLGPSSPPDVKRSLPLAAAAVVGAVLCCAALGWACSAHLAGMLRSGQPGSPRPSGGPVTAQAPQREWPSSNDEDRDGSAQLIGTTMKKDDPLLMTFYMYRAQSNWDYPLENVNAADLPGVMYYLHNEILGGAPRKYNVTRLLRYKVTLKPTKEVFEMTGTQFGQFVAFDSGRCTSPECAEKFEQYGYNVGCQVLDPKLSSYMSPFQTKHNCKPGESCPGVWYSLPGQCPSKDLVDKTQECVDAEMGGACASVTGDKICTYHYEHAGELHIDEISGLDDSTAWWEDRSKAEYVKKFDNGVGTDFWKGKMNITESTRRMDEVQAMFVKKYPSLPETYGTPPCDFTH